MQGSNSEGRPPSGNTSPTFECLAAKLIIELDGGQHQVQASYDLKRTKYLQARGYRVLRFWNNEVLTDTDAVLHSILLALETKAEPQKGGTNKSPLPAGEG